MSALNSFALFVPFCGPGSGKEVLRLPSPALPGAGSTGRRRSRVALSAFVPRFGAGHRLAPLNESHHAPAAWVCQGMGKQGKQGGGAIRRSPPCCFREGRPDAASSSCPRTPGREQKHKLNLLNASWCAGGRRGRRSGLRESAARCSPACSGTGSSRIHRGYGREMRPLRAGSFCGFPPGA